jgi:hypothetical protein
VAQALEKFATRSRESAMLPHAGRAIDHVDDGLGLDLYVKEREARADRLARPVVANR